MGAGGLKQPLVNNLGNMTLIALVQTARKQGVWRTLVSSPQMSAGTPTVAVRPPAGQGLAKPYKMSNYKAGLEMLG